VVREEEGVNGLVMGRGEGWREFFMFEGCDGKERA
jgi:hypothetical protein